jgi:ketosteroid isomerase-like protein
MSQADVESLRARYEAVSNGDRAAAFRDVDPDFELKTVGRVPNAGTYRGAEAATQFLEDLWEPFDRVTIEPEEFFEQGDRVAVFLRTRFHHEGSDAEVENRIGALWTMRDGRPVRCEMFPQREKALQALKKPPA